MVHPSVIEARLGQLGFRASRWFRAEIRELEHVLMDGEEIIVLVCGRYFGSFALLVATDQRLLLIDKRVFFMTIEDTRYDMISEIDFNSQAYNATVTVFTVNKTHKFTSIKHKAQLRELTRYVQQRVMEFRNQQSGVMPGAVQSMNMPLAPVPRAVPSLAAELSAVQPAAVDYNYSPAVSNDSPRPAEASHGVAQLVGSAAMRASHSHPRVRRPLNPYVQGSLMTRRPMGSPTDY